MPASPTITQTADGYFWMSSIDKDHLIRFDGVQFVPWLPPKGNPLPGKITYLLGARDGSLWIGSRTGVSRLKDGKLSTITKPSDHFGISVMIEDDAGKIWLTRYNTGGGGSLCEIGDHGLRCYGPSDGVPAGFALGLAQDAAGNLWFAADNVYRWKPGTSATPYLDSPKHPQLIDIAAEHSGNVWATMQEVGPKFGVQYFHNGAWGEYSVGNFHSSSVKSSTLFVDRAGAVWIGTDNDGLYRVWNGIVDHFSRSDGLSGRNVTFLYEDHEGNLWVSTDGGLDLFRNTPVITYSMDEGTDSNSINNVLASRDGTIWAGDSEHVGAAGTTSSTILRPQDLGFSKGPKFPGRLESMFQDRSGALWFSIENGMLVAYEHGKAKEILGRDGHALHAPEIRMIIEDQSQTILAVNENKLFRIRDHRVVEAIDLPKDLIPAGHLAVNPAGGIWIVSLHRGVGLYQGGNIQVHPLPTSTKLWNVYGVIADSADPLLLATSQGLLRWNGVGWDTLNDTNGFPCDVLMGAVKDRDGSLWVMADCGLVKVEASELQKWREKPEIHPSFAIFDALDGARPGSSYNFEPRMSLGPDGKLWFANGNAIQMIDPDHVYRNLLPPPVHVDQLIADNKEFQTSGQPRLPPNTHNLEINYTAASFSVPQKVRFRYLLEGHDKTWQGPVTRRQAFYNDLAPGTYRFRVVACNNSGVWNETGDVATFIVEPAFYQTIWFRCLIVLAAAFALWVFYKQRLKRATAEISARLGERLQERERIARALHDTLLQDFQSVILRFQLAANGLSKADPSRTALEEGLDYADKVLAEGRNYIRDIRADTKGLDELSESLAQYGNELSQLRQIAFVLSVTGSQFELDPIVRDEIYRIGREGIGNAFKHSKGSKIEVEIAYQLDEFQLKIHDDGNGIEPDLASGGRPGHWGIRNMKERAQNIGANLEISSRPGQGTLLELKLPARSARGSRTFRRTT